MIVPRRERLTRFGFIERGGRERENLGSEHEATRALWGLYTATRARSALWCGASGSEKFETAEKEKEEEKRAYCRDNRAIQTVRAAAAAAAADVVSGVQGYSIMVNRLRSLARSLARLPSAARFLANQNYYKTCHLLLGRKQQSNQARGPKLNSTRGAPLFVSRIRSF